MGSWGVRGTGRRGGALAGALALSLVLGGCGGSGPGGGAPKASPSPSAPSARALPEVVVGVVAARAVRPEFQFPAEIRASETVEIRARVQGTLLPFTVRDGDRVGQGQLLFRLEDAPYQAAVAQARAQEAQAQAQLGFARNQVEVRTAEAQLASARTELSRARQEVERYRPLAEGEVIPRQTFDDAVAQRDVAAARVRAAEAQLQNTKLSAAASLASARAAVEAARAAVGAAELNVGYCSIPAPVSGVIEVDVDSGNLVGPPAGGPPLARITAVDPIYVKFSISDAAYLRLMERKREHELTTPGGALFTLTLADGAVHPHHGRFDTVMSGLDAKTGTIGLRAVFPNPGGVLRDGQYGQIQVLGTRAAEALMIPQRAVVTLQSLQVVYVLGADGKVSSRTVETGRTEGEDVEVTSGLQVGERIVVEGVQKLKDGVEVRVREGEAAAAPGQG